MTYIYNNLQPELPDSELDLILGWTDMDIKSSPLNKSINNVIVL